MAAWTVLNSRAPIDRRTFLPKWPSTLPASSDHSYLVDFCPMPVNYGPAAADTVGSPMLNGQHPLAHSLQMKAFTSAASMSSYGCLVSNTWYPLFRFKLIITGYYNIFDTY